MGEDLRHGSGSHVVTLRPLGRVQAALETVGLDVTYAYDDLVFVQHGLLVLQFDDEDVETLYLFSNAELPPEAAEREAERTRDAFEGTELRLVEKGRFQLTQSPDSTVAVTFC